MGYLVLVEELLVEYESVRIVASADPRRIGFYHKAPIRGPVLRVVESGSDGSEIFCKHIGALVCLSLFLHHEVSAHPSYEVLSDFSKVIH